MINCFQFVMWGLLVFIIKAENQLQFEEEKMLANTNINTKLIDFKAAELKQIHEYSFRILRSNLKPSKYHEPRSVNLETPLKLLENKKDLTKIREYSRRSESEFLKSEKLKSQSKTRNLKSSLDALIKSTENKLKWNYISEHSREFKEQRNETLRKKIRKYSQSTKPAFLKSEKLKSQSKTKNLKSSLDALIKSTENKLEWNYISEHSREFKEQRNEALRNPAKIVKILQENLSVRNLKSFLKVDTLILFGSKESLRKSSHIFTLQHPARLIVRQENDQELRNLYSSNILSIVFLNSGKTLEESLLETVKISLKRKHLKKLIFITPTPIGKSLKPGKLFRELFNWLHHQGFWNSLLMDLAGNSLAFADLSGTFLWNLSLNEFLQINIKWSDLQGFPIRCAMASNPPSTYIYHDSSHKVSLKGYYGTIINLFVKYYNASLEPFILNNIDYYTELDCVRYIKQHKVDICGDVLTLNPDYVISNPAEISANYLMVPYDKPLPRFYYFLKPLQLQVWTIVTGSFFYKIITLSFIHRLQHGYWNASQQILYATLSVMFLPFQLTRVKGPYRKFLELIMILVGFVVANWYLSVLSSLLFARLYSQDIKNLQDLAHHNISIMVNDFDIYLLNATENNPFIKQQLHVVSNDILQHHRRNLDPHYAYYSQLEIIKFYLHQQKFLLRPRMKILTGIPPINQVFTGIPMSPNWPFQHLLNDFMRRIAVSGLYQRLLVKAREEGISTRYLQYFPTEHHYVEPLSIEYFQMPAMLLAGGYSLALVGFLLEIFVFKEF